MEAAMSKAAELSQRSSRPAQASGLTLPPIDRRFESDRLLYRNLTIEFDRGRGAANITVYGPQTAPAHGLLALERIDASFWPLALARDLDDAILHLRFNEERIGTWVFRSEGNGRLVEEYDRLLFDNQNNWLVREIVSYLKRVFKRLDVSSRSLFTLIEPGSCFAGTLLELALAADRAYMLNGTREGQEETAPLIRLTQMNFGPLPKCNGLARLENRFLGDKDHIQTLKQRLAHAIDTELAAELGLVGFIPDEIDWDDEIRLALVARAAFSSDALTGLEASLRFAGPETIETKIFARLSAWQNWIFQRPNAVGENGALKLYGTGKRPTFDARRV
jgi:benzoyl-CoA-dihydrodiol lyase